MRVKLTQCRSGYDAGRSFFQAAGQVIDVDEQEGRRMIATGLAVGVVETTMVESGQRERSRPGTRANRPAKG